jgi:hypothetical protein
MSRLNMGFMHSEVVSHNANQLLYNRFTFRTKTIERSREYDRLDANGQKDLYFSCCPNP